MKNKWVPALAGLLMLSSNFLRAETTENTDSLEALEKEIPQFGKIDEQIYRGGQPSEEGLRLLKSMGVETIINFRHEKDEIEKERKIAEELGMKYISIPWRVQWHPRNPVMQEFLAEVGREEGPFFIHCRRGAERTGVADAIYRHRLLGENADTAWRNATKKYDIQLYWRPFMKKRYNSFVKEFSRRPS